MNSGGGGGDNDLTYITGCGNDDEVVGAIYTIYEEQGMDTINLTPDLASSSKLAVPPRSILLALVVLVSNERRVRRKPGIILSIISSPQATYMQISRYAC
jgi:hypothetical protein